MLFKMIFTIILLISTTHAGKGFEVIEEDAKPHSASKGAQIMAGAIIMAPIWTIIGGKVGATLARNRCEEKEKDTCAIGGALEGGLIGLTFGAGLGALIVAGMQKNKKPKHSNYIIGVKPMLALNYANTKRIEAGDLGLVINSKGELGIAANVFRMTF